MIERHLYSYSLEGARYVLEVPAQSEEEGRRRLGLASMGCYKGIANVPPEINDDGVFWWLLSFLLKVRGTFRMLKFIGRLEEQR